MNFLFILGLFDLLDSMEQVWSLIEVIFRGLSYDEDEGAIRALKEKVVFPVFKVNEQTFLAISYLLNLFIWFVEPVKNIRNPKSFIYVLEAIFADLASSSAGPS